MTVENTLAEFQRSSEGLFLASVKEAKTTLAEIHSKEDLAVLPSISTRRVPIFLCWQKTGTVACRCGGVSCISWEMCPSCTHSKEEVDDGGTKQIVSSQSKKHTDKTGWEVAELAPRVATRRSLQHRAGA